MRHDLLDVAAGLLLPPPAALLLPPLAPPVEAHAAAYRHQQEEQDADGQDQLALVLPDEPHDGSAGVAPVLPLPWLFCRRCRGRCRENWGHPQWPVGTPDGGPPTPCPVPKTRGPPDPVDPSSVVAPPPIAVILMPPEVGEAPTVNEKVCAAATAVTVAVVFRVGPPEEEVQGPVHHLAHLVGAPLDGDPAPLAPLDGAPAPSAPSNGVLRDLLLFSCRPPLGETQ